MLDDFRFQVAEEVLRTLFRQLFLMNAAQGFEFENWDSISPDISMSRNRFEEIRIEISSMLNHAGVKSLDVDKFIQEIEPKLQAISTGAEVERIIPRLIDILHLKDQQILQVLGEKNEQSESSGEPLSSQEDHPLQGQELTQDSMQNNASDYDPDILKENLISEDMNLVRQAARIVIEHNIQDLVPFLLELEEKQTPHLAVVKACTLRLLPYAKAQYQSRVYNYLLDRDVRVIATAIESLEELGTEKAMA